MKQLATILAALTIIAGPAAALALADSHHGAKPPTVAQLATHVAKLEHELKALKASVANNAASSFENYKLLSTHGLVINCLVADWTAISGYPADQFTLQAPYGPLPAGTVLLAYPTGAFPNSSSCMGAVQPCDKGKSQPLTCTLPTIPVTTAKP